MCNPECEQFDPCNEDCGEDGEGVPYGPCHPDCLDDDCKISITDDGNELAEYYCVGAEFTICASGCPDPEKQECCDCVDDPAPNDDFSWTVTGGATILGGDTGDCITIRIDQPGEFTVSVAKGCCRGSLDSRAVSIRIIMDYDNAHGFSLPSTEPQAGPTDPPGKIIFTNIGDRDRDGIPDYADGYSHPDLGPDGQFTSSPFVPMRIEVEGISPSDFENWSLRFDYSASPPLNLTVQQHNGGPPTGWLTFWPAPGRFRLWTKDGTLARSGEDVSEGGDFLSHMTIYPTETLLDSSGEVELYVEAIHRSFVIDADFISVELLDENEDVVCSAKGAVTSVDLEIHDLRHWGPLMDDGWSGHPGIQNSDLYAYPSGIDSYVGGAITDGASVCLIRCMPPLAEFEEFGFAISVLKDHQPSTSDPTAVGSLYQTHNSVSQTIQLPLLPAPGFPSPPWQPTTINMMRPTVFYVPPESYSDPNHVPDPGNSLNTIESCRIDFRVEQYGTVLMELPFLLRRPPLVLVHGIMSDPNTWDSMAWNETNGAPVPTRMYKLDWSGTSTKGYSQHGAFNYGKVALKIEEALEHYRTANDAGHSSIRGFKGIRFAATRADVVAHSQGGQLTRWYIADGIQQNIPREGWIADLSNIRDEGSPLGNWPYLRDGNWGAGSIRRFIPLGSPFKGSPWANFAAPWFAPGNAGEPSNDPAFVALAGWYFGDFTPPFPSMPSEFASLLFTSPEPPGAYIEPNCGADLSEGSEAQLALEAAFYPSGNQVVRWFPIVGIATEPPGEGTGQAILWEVLFTFLPMVPTQPGNWSPLSPANSDLIVPACSQRNLSAGCDAGQGPGQHFNYTAHVRIAGLGGGTILDGETTSNAVSQKVKELLSAWPTWFDSNWSMGQ